MRPFYFSICLIFVSAVTYAQPLRFFEFGFRNPLPDEMNVIAAASDTARISKTLDQLALPEAQRSLFISGELQYGTGTNNPLYSWHFVTDSWDLVETAIEVCDGTPSDVENDKKYWIETVGQFCPWSSFTKREITPSDVGDNTVDGSVTLYPNPTSGILRIEMKADATIRSMYILDAEGRRFSDLPVGQCQTLELSLMPAGVYYVVIQHARGNSIYKFIKK
jgi:hypothetical protein